MLARVVAAAQRLHADRAGAVARRRRPRARATITLPRSCPRACAIASARRSAVPLGASRFAAWCSSTISASKSGPSRRAASPTRCASTFTATEKFGAHTIGMRAAAASSSARSAAEKPVVPHTYATPRVGGDAQRRAGRARNREVDRDARRSRTRAPRRRRRARPAPPRCRGPGGRATRARRRARRRRRPRSRRARARPCGRARRRTRRAAARSKQPQLLQHGLQPLAVAVRDRHAAAGAAPRGSARASRARPSPESGWSRRRARRRSGSSR